ncbi:MAG TPA: hypothetical protein VFG59_19720 [Anaeromyxobacter sp.]|nr:hypothetical protein [Anaeromyxobacter sp.]
MRLRPIVAAAPVVIAALLVALAQATGPGQALLAYELEGTVVKALAALACALAAMRIPPGNRLRHAWILQAACYLALALKTLPVLSGNDLAVRVGTLTANVLAPLAQFLMIRAFWGAGLAPALPPRARWLAPLATFTVALALAGPSIVSHVRMMTEDPSAILLVFSSVGDLASITLLAPLLLIAAALRGGRLAWPYAFMAAGEACWLLYDVANAFAPMVLERSWARALWETLRLSACLYYAWAGVAQRAAFVRHPAQLARRAA